MYIADRQALLLRQASHQALRLEGGGAPERYLRPSPLRTMLQLSSA